VEARYHSAPSVIHEVLHRRDWERSSKDLYIPLNPQNECNSSIKSIVSSSPEAPCAEAESSSIECLEVKEQPKKCKKHHTNIKSSKNRCKESNQDDVKDTDATEAPNFYIGEEEFARNNEADELGEYQRLQEDRNKSMYKAKGDKQSLNESIRLRAWSPTPSWSGGGGGVDRSGAVHHTIESRTSFSRPYPLPPPSVGQSRDLPVTTISFF
jgi:hypothetical protein